MPRCFNTESHPDVRGLLLTSIVAYLSFAAGPSQGFPTDITFVRKDHAELAATDSVLLSFRSSIGPWIANWQSAVPGFGLSSLQEVGVTPFRPIDDQPYRTDSAEHLRMRHLYVFSPDRTKCLDPFTGYELMGGEENLHGGWDAGSGVALIDLKRKTRESLVHCESACEWSDVAWAGNDRFAIMAWSGSDVGRVGTKPDTGASVRFFPFLMLYDLRKQTVSLYRGPNVDTGTLEKARTGIHARWRKLHPGIDFE